ncbi:hypothetical protein AAG570_009828 [Ranatra chinensis]|uniref:ABC-2 type transporter transmembrane domain-containing protein n=1 Tax=Ranatra chinensis TaxID=642074 RepID=A0ABD0YQ87_9HEMI
MFHNVILVAEGTIVYNGSSNGAIEFFQTEGYTMGKLCTPGEFLVNTLAPTPGSELSTQAAVKRLSLQFALSEQAKTNDMVIKYEQQVAKVRYSNKCTNLRKPPLWISKFYWLWFRSVLEIIRNPNIQWIKIFQKLIVGLMVGFCYLGTVELTQNGLQSVQGVLFLLVTENTFAPMYAALSYFPVQFPMFIREYKNAVYSPFLFYITSILSQFPGLVVEAVLFSTCVYWMAGLQLTAYAYLMTMLISILCINVSAACGTMFSAAFNTPSTAMAYLIPFDYVVMITSGLFIKLSTLPEVIGWIKYLSWFMYSYESLTITQWGGIYNISCIENRPYLPCLETGADVIEKFSFSEDNLDLDILAMLGLYFGFLAIGYIFFKFKIKKQP